MHVILVFHHAALMNTINSADFMLAWNIAQVLEKKSWPEVAANLGCSQDYIRTLYQEWESGTLHYPSRPPEWHAMRMDSTNNKCFVSVIADWTAKKEGTGRPRNWKTVLQVIKSCCINSKEALSRVLAFESRLVEGVNVYTPL